MPLCGGSMRRLGLRNIGQQLMEGFGSVGGKIGELMGLARLDGSIDGLARTISMDGSPVASRF